MHSGQHPTFSRLAFDRPARFAYAVARNGASVTVRFDALVDADLSRVRATHLSAVTGIMAAASETLTVTLDIDPWAAVRYTALDDRVFVDLIPARYRARQLWDSRLLPPEPDEPAVSVDGGDIASSSAIPGGRFADASAIIAR